MTVSAIVIGLFVFPGLLGTVAQAQTGSGGAASNSALSWMNVRDSTGVDLSDYMFATDTHTSLLDPARAGLIVVIGVEFAGWIVIVTTGIWLIGYVLSFQWLDLLAAPLRTVARSLTQTFGASSILITAVAVGAFCVAWFVLRGLHAKATVQVVTMLCVAILGPVMFADPLAEVLSSNGWLSQARDVGISVAAGLNGDRSPQPGQLISTMQQDLADNFARRPLQTWNFGHVIDGEPACRQAWTTAVKVGDEDQLKTGIHDCGDRDAYSATKNPSFGQIGAGLLVLLTGTLLLAFAAVLSLRIVRSGLDSVYHGLMSIFGFAAGGFIYGPSQTFLVRNLVHGFFAAARMSAEIVFLGIYVLVLGDLFRQAGGQVMPVFVIGAILEVVAIIQLKRLTESLDRGNDWLANRFALRIQGDDQPGGLALGMGTIGARRHGLGVIGTFSAINTVVGSPVTGMAMRGLRLLLPRSEGPEPDNHTPEPGAGSARGIGDGGGWQAQRYVHRRRYVEAARRGILASGTRGGTDTYIGAAAAIQAAIGEGAGRADLSAALSGAGFRDEAMTRKAVEAWGEAQSGYTNRAGKDERLGYTAAAMRRVHDLASQSAGSGSGLTEEDTGDVAAAVATLHAMSHQLQSANARGVHHGGQLDDNQQRYLEDYLTDPTREKLEILGHLAHTAGLTEYDTASGQWKARNGSGGTIAEGVARLQNNGIDRAAAGRMWVRLGEQHATRVHRAVTDLVDDPTNPMRLEVTMQAVEDATETQDWTPSGMPSVFQ
ncbi:hypothetical protein GCM10027262_76990 [Nocardia tengchongensis]